MRSAKKTQKIIKFWGFWGVIGILWLLALPAKAQFSVTKSVDKPNVLSGEVFTYSLFYSYSNLESPIENLVITDVLPSNVEFVSLTGTGHTVSETFNSATNTVTFVFQSPFPPGGTGTLNISCRFPNGTTPNGSTATNTATITDGITSVTSDPVVVTATASDQISFSKYGTSTFNGLVGTVALGEIYDYTLEVCNSTANGTLTASNVVISDALPTGAEFVSASGGVYDPGTNTVTWTPQTLAIGACSYKHLILRFPSSQFSLGQTIVNTGSVTYDLVGGSSGTLSDNADVVVSNPINEVKVDKTLPYGSSYSAGSASSYNIAIKNTGNTTLQGYYLVDVIPTGIEITEINLGGWYFPTITNSSTPAMIVEYKTNLNSNYTSIQPPYYTKGQLEDNTNIFVSNLGLASGEIITEIKWTLLNDFLPSSFTYVPMSLKFVVLASASIGPLVNCLTCHATATYGAGGPNTGPGGQGGSSGSGAPFTIIGSPCVTMTVEAPSTVPVPRPSKLGPGTVSVGDTVTYTIAANSSNQIGIPASINPVLYDLLPLGVEYVSGSMVNLNDNLFPEADVFTATPNYNGTGRTLLKWQWLDDTLPVGFSSDTYTFDVVITALVPTGNLVNTILQTGENGNDCSGWGYQDIYDLDGDSNTTEYFCQASATSYTNATAALESQKLVKGQCDQTYSQFPDFGRTMPGGLADYVLKVKNVGNIPATNVQIIDILPWVGDVGVLVAQNRGSQWRPNLAGPVTPPAGVTVYYSTETNPCRPELNNNPTGCVNANWSLTPPSDITQVQALKFDFGSIVLQPLQELYLTWPMRAPTDAPTNDEIAWNSFGFIATRTDNNIQLLPAEPAKVGIQLKPINPAVYGNYVWLDTNQNGLQDDGATGVSGVTVHLYIDNGDGISDPNTDAYYGFTVTDNGGIYLFPNLLPGDYFAVFYPPTGYAASPDNQGPDDTIDSDGIITPVTHLDLNEVDLTWDLGIFASPDCDVNITSFTTSPCTYSAGNSTTTVNIFVEWGNAPVGEDIVVSIDGANAQTISATGGTTSPALISIVIPADGLLHTINAAFASTTSCSDTRTFSAPLPCQPNVCLLDIISASSSACVYGGGNSTSTITANIGWSGIPPGEDIYLKWDNVIVDTIFASGGIISPQIINFNVPADGANHILSAEFSVSTTCTDNISVAAPAPCPPAACSINVDSAVPGACDPNTNTYSLDVTVTYANPPGTGLTINIGGVDYSVTTTGASPETFTISGLAANGANTTVTATFVDNATCTDNLDTPYTAPMSCTPTCPPALCLPVIISKTNP